MAGADRLNGRRELFRRNPSDAKALGPRAEQPSDNAALRFERGFEHASLCTLGSVRGSDPGGQL